MSASLVGSEMCIRDRGLGGLGPAASSSFRERTKGPQLMDHNEGTAAVSYTHLTLPTICSV
eukprot:12331200-Alexandrium_andersonii.AAC.1